MWYLKKKMIQVDLFIIEKQTHGDQVYGYQRGMVESGVRLDVWDWHIHTTVSEVDDQQGPAVEHGELSILVMTYMGGSENQETHVYVRLNRLAVHLKPTQLCWSTILQYKMQI